MPGRVATAPVNAPRTWPNSSLSIRFSGIAPQLTTMNGPSLRGLRWCTARAISSLPVPVSPVMSTLMSVRRDLLHLAEHLEHRRAGADDVAEALVLELLLELRRSVLRLSSEHRVLQDQRGLAGEDREQVERALLEQVHDVVVADVEHAEQLALRHQRRAHHRAQLEVHHALAGLEVLVVERVADDQRPAASTSRAGRCCRERWRDAVRQVLRARRLRATATRGSPSSIRIRKPLSALVTSIDRVHQRLEQLGDALDLHQALAELVELAQAGELGRGVVVFGVRAAPALASS